MSVKRHYILTILAVAIATAVGPAQPEPPAAPTSDALEIYKTPLASAGLVQVFLGTGGKLVRTTSLRVQSYELEDAGKTLIVYVSAAITPSEIEMLAEQLKQHVMLLSPPSTQRNATRVETITPKQLTWITPHSIEAILETSDGKPLGRYQTRRSDPNDRNTIVGPLAIDPSRSLPFHFSLPTPLANPATAERYKITLNTSYRVREISIQSAELETVTTTAWVVLENVLGGRPAPGDYLTRDAKQVVSQHTDVRRSLKLINTDPETAKWLLDQLTAKMAKPQTTPEQEFEKADKLIIWSPLLGREEVKATIKDLQDYESRLKTSTKARLGEKKKLLHEEAKKFGSFEEWYKEQQSRRDTNVAGALDISMEASLLDIIGNVKGATKANFSFQESVGELMKGSAKRQRYEDLYNKLINESELNKDDEQEFEKTWIGNNRIVETVGKSIMLDVARDYTDFVRDITAVSKQTVRSVAKEMRIPGVAQELGTSAIKEGPPQGEADMKPLKALVEKQAKKLETLHKQLIDNGVIRKE
jgi:hypothetical protein